MRYWGPLNSAGGIYGDDGYVDGNPATGTEGSIPTFRGFEQTLRELTNLVDASGLTPDTVMDDVQVARAVQNGVITFGVDTGTPNAMVVTLDPAPLAYVAGNRIAVLKGANANTAACTISVNGIGYNTIKRPNGTDVVANDLLPNSLLLLGYDGTNWRVLGGSAAVNAGGGQVDLVVALFDATTTWTVPAGCYHIQVELWAAGGGGGSGDGATWGGGGGGGGEYGLGYYAVTPGQVLNITIGIGGAGSNSPGNSGIAGGSSSVVIAGGATLLVCGGGFGGGIPGMQGAAGGTGGWGGSEMLAGFGGFIPSLFPSGSPGGGTARGTGYAMQGNVGTVPGGGGSGAQWNNAIGNLDGADGRCKITYAR